MGQGYYWTAEWQASEAEADADLRAGRSRVFPDMDAAVAYLTGGRASVGVDLKACRAALVRLADEDMILDAAIDELAALREVEAAAREVLATWDRTLPEGVGIEFFATLIDLREALASVRLIDPEPTPEELARAEALARRLGR